MSTAFSLTHDGTPSAPKMSDNEKPTTTHVPSHQQGPDGDAFAADIPPHEGMGAGKYLATRFSTLKPPMHKLRNPFKLLAMLTGQNWAFFGVAFFAWVCVL